MVLKRKIKRTAAFIAAIFLMNLYMGTQAGIASAAAMVSQQGERTANDAAMGSQQSKRFNMSYIYFGAPASYADNVDDTGGSLSDISPSYFDLNEDGTLKLTIAVDRNFISEMHKRGIKVTPFLSNHWNEEKGNNALINREQLSSQIADAVEEYNLDGVNIDIENVNEKQRDNYTDFIRLLREKLPENRSLSVAVAPNPWELTTGWYGSYDYEKLSQYCDYLMVMAYDQHYQGGEPGPVAGYKFVEDTIKAALKRVPAKKLVLGMAFYGRLWKQGSSYGGYGISNNTVEELIGKFRGKVTFDAVTRSPKATITIYSSDKKPIVFGKALEAGKYDIWYENEDSIKSKLKLVDKYDLKGTGSWSLGQEAKSTWGYYSLWLNGKYFEDAEGNWARQSIISVMNKGWMIGVSGTRFSPDEAVTRAQAAAILVRALGINKDDSNRGEQVLSDIENHWAYAEIMAAYENDLIVGTGEGRFEPEKALTREEMAVLLERVLDVNTNAVAAFHDVTKATCPWSFNAINKIAAIGVLQGYPDKGFHPKDTINRAQIAALMDRTTSYLK